jgi:hypothetical protein
MEAAEAPTAVVACEDTSLRSFDTMPYVSVA